MNTSKIAISTEMANVIKSAAETNSAFGGWTYKNLKEAAEKNNKEAKNLLELSEKAGRGKGLGFQAMEDDYAIFASLEEAIGIPFEVTHKDGSKETRLSWSLPGFLFREGREPFYFEFPFWELRKLSNNIREILEKHPESVNYQATRREIGDFQIGQRLSGKKVRFNLEEDIKTVHLPDRDVDYQTVLQFVTILDD